MRAWRGRSRREKRRDERGRCARKGAKLTRGPGSAARVSSASQGGMRARAEHGLQACWARAERRDAVEVGRGYLGCAEEVGTGERPRGASGPGSCGRGVAQASRPRAGLGRERRKLSGPIVGRKREESWAGLGV